MDKTHNDAKFRAKFTNDFKRFYKAHRLDYGGDEYDHMKKFRFDAKKPKGFWDMEDGERVYPIYQEEKENGWTTTDGLIHEAYEEKTGKPIHVKEAVKRMTKKVKDIKKPRLKAIVKKVIKLKKTIQKGRK